MESTADRALVAFVSSPHAGYLKLFRKYGGHGSMLYVLGSEFIEQFTALKRFLPAATPEENCRMVHALGIFDAVRVLTLDRLADVRGKDIVMPDEDVSHAVAEKYLPEEAVSFDGTWRLRWDWGATLQNRRPEGETVVTRGEFERRLMLDALGLAKKSPDWWRQNGALLLRDGEVLLAAFNRHMPHEQSAYLEGDPRDNFGPGVRVEISLAAHAESSLIATAARRGIRTEGCDLVSPIFPCPWCANNTVSQSGLKSLYYMEGYTVVAGADAIRAANIEIIRVDMTQEAPS